MSKAVRAEIETFTRKLLDERLAKLPPNQLAFFNRIYPSGVPESSLISAIDLCDRAIRKNEKDPSRVEPEVVYDP